MYNLEFIYKGGKLDCVREYKYLGVHFCMSESFSLASSELYKKRIKSVLQTKRYIWYHTPKH